MAQPIDVSALYGALDSRRTTKNLSWRKLAKELELSPSIFTRLAQGRQPQTGSYLAMVDWLGKPRDAFFDRGKPTVQEAEDTLAAINGYLRADKALKAESAKAIAKIVETAYAEMAEKK
jgi:transcriptional regulator with XRE-family HTH domain